MPGIGEGVGLGAGIKAVRHSRHRLAGLPLRPVGGIGVLQSRHSVMVRVSGTVAPKPITLVVKIVLSDIG